MTEADTQAAIRLALGRRDDVRLWRNNVGEAWLGRVIHQTASEVVIARPSRVRYGLCTGSSDLIGARRMTVTQAMVGTVIAQFVAAECKPPKRGKPTSEQLDFIDFVNAFGGIAGVVRSVDDALALIGTAA